MRDLTRQTPFTSNKLIAAIAAVLLTALAIVTAKIAIEVNSSQKKPLATTSTLTSLEAHRFHMARPPCLPEQQLKRQDHSALQIIRKPSLAWSITDVERTIAKPPAAIKSREDDGELKLSKWMTPAARDRPNVSARKCRDETGPLVGLIQLCKLQC